MAVPKKQVVDFVSKYGQQIIAGIDGTGLFFPAVVANLALESEWGNSALAKNNFNFAKIVQDDKAREQGNYATYTDFPSFMTAYVKTLNLQSFKDAGVFTATTPQAQLEAIAKGGYAVKNASSYAKRGGDVIAIVQGTYKIGKIKTGSATTVDDVFPPKKNKGAIADTKSKATGNATDKAADAATTGAEKKSTMTEKAQNTMLNIGDKTSHAVDDAMDSLSSLFHKVK